jgi:hypothetical protein
LGPTEIVWVLLSLGVRSVRALEYSCRSDTTDTLKTVLRLGDIPTSDMFQSSMDVAIRGGNVPAMEVLLEYGAEAGPHTLQYACWYENPSMVSLLLEHGLQPTSVILEHLCQSRPMEATRARKILSIVSMILEHGAIPSVYALGYACSRGNLEIVRLLLQYGAVPNEQMIEDACPHFEIVRLLLEHGVTPTERVFLAACGSGTVEVVRLLLCHLSTDKLDLQSALEAAIARLSSEAILVVLIETGAIPTSDMLELACASGNTVGIITLVRYGSKPTGRAIQNLYDFDLKIAEARSGHTKKLVNLLLESMRAALQRAM